MTKGKVSARRLKLLLSDLVCRTKACFQVDADVPDVVRNACFPLPWEGPGPSNLIRNLDSSICPPLPRPPNPTTLGVMRGSYKGPKWVTSCL